MLSNGKGKGFEAWVESKDDRVRLNEYQVEHHPARDGKSAYTECFLETIDEPFRIKVTKLASLRIKSDWECSCLIDGKNLSYNIWFERHIAKRWKSVYQEENGQYYKCSLLFSPLSTTDDKSKVTIDSSAWSTMGSIELVLKKGKYRPSYKLGLHVGSSAQGTADEKAKKFAYTVSTGERELVPNTAVTSYTFTPSGSGEVFYRFVFKYRPRAVLVQTRIIDEPEPEEPARPRKRKHANESAIALEGEEEEDDVKPSLAKRLKYLEGRVQELNSENKRLRAGGSSANDSIDLTQGSDGE
ncbi:hypothetical protein IAT40_000552 [Kwoniella sp. CBS 6097]